jgi:hypothetical protein
MPRRGPISPIGLGGYFRYRSSGSSQVAAYLTSDTSTWSTPWIDVSIAGLALVTVQGPLVAGPRAKLLRRALDENAVGPLDERARRLTRDPALWIVILANPGIVLGITWDMTVKPGTAGAIAAVLAGYAVGAVAARPLTSRSRSVDWGR